MSSPDFAQTRMDSPQRSDLIDALRAIALFGVIMVNIAGITMIVMAPKIIAAAGPADIGIMIFEILFIFGKARAAFAFLFGVGFGILLERAVRRGGNFQTMFVRGMLALFAFGVINQVFFFFGDILANYALLGLVLILFRRASDRMLLITGFVLIILPPLFAGVAEIIVGGTLPNLSWQSIAAATAMTSALGLEAYRSERYIDVISFNASWPFYAVAGNPVHRIVYNLSVFGMFLLGYFAARHRLLMDIESGRPMLRKAVRWLIPIGIVMNAAFAMGPLGIELNGMLRGLVTASFCGPPILSLGFLAAGALLFSRHAKRLQALLAPAGRMALTNYLASGAIGTYCFYGYGLGLLGTLNFAAMALFALVLFLGLLAFSHIWLSMFRIGPVEWIWRSLTYGGMQPILRVHRTDQPTPQF